MSGANVNCLNLGKRNVFFFVMIKVKRRQANTFPRTVAKAAPNTSQRKISIKSASKIIFEIVPVIFGSTEAFPSPSALRILQKKDGNWDFREGMQKQMEFYYRNKETIKVHLENAEKTEVFETFFDLPLDKEFLEGYQTFFHLKNEKEVQYHQEFFNTGMTAAVRRWVLSDCKESPEEMTDLLCRIFRVAF